MNHASKWNSWTVLPRVTMAFDFGYLPRLNVPLLFSAKRPRKAFYTVILLFFSCRPVKLIMSEWELCSIPPITFSKLFGMLLQKKKKKIGMWTIDHGSSSASSWLGLGLQPWPICSGPYSSTRNINTKAFFLKMKMIFFFILKYFCILFVLEKTSDETVWKYYPGATGTRVGKGGIYFFFVF